MLMNSKPIKWIAQQGLGMVEMLVALILLGVGLLGALSLQANGLQSNQRATFVTEAHFLAQDMVERIISYGSTMSNANAGANNGEYGAINTYSNTYLDPGCGSVGNSCDLVDTVDLDKFDWQQRLSNSGLPSVRGSVVWNDPVYTIRVMWDRDRTGATGTDCDSTDKMTHLTCFDMQLSL